MSYCSAIRLSLRWAIIAVATASVGLAGCERTQPASKPAAKPVPEPKLVQEIRALGEAASAEASAAGKNGKTASGASQSAIRKAYERAVAEGNAATIMEYVEKCVKGGGPNGIAYALQADIVFDLISRPDKAELARVLSWGSTDVSSYWCIEEALTRDASDHQLTDGLDVLFDGYDLSKTAEAKDANYFAVWRALGDLPIKTANTDEYMRVARGWYRENRSRLVRLRGYDHTDFEWWRFGDRKGQEPRHLFELPGPGGAR